MGDFSTLQTTLITRFNDLEAKLTSIIADQMKNMFMEINDKIDNLNSKLDNMEDRLNKRIDKELSSIGQKFTIDLKTHSDKFTEFEARLVASSNTKAVIEVTERLNELERLKHSSGGLAWNSIALYNIQLLIYDTTAFTLILNTIWL